MNRREFIVVAAAVPLVAYVGRRVLERHNETVVLSQTLDSRDYDKIVITNCHIIPADNFTGRAIISLHPDADYLIYGNLIEAPKHTGLEFLS